MPVVDFQQDPNAPYGTGNFRDEQGRISYTHDPDTASRFVKTMAGSSVAPPVVSPGAPAPMSQPAPEPLMSVQPEPTAPAPTPTTPSHPTAQALLAVTGAALQPLQVSGVSTTTSSGRPKAAIEADKQRLGDTFKSNTQDITDIGQARRDRAETVAQAGQGAAMSQALGGLQDLSTASGEQQLVQRKLSETLAEKDPEVDPGRLMRNRSTGSKLATVVLAALSGGFAAVAGQKTQAIDIINGQIDADIAAQEKEIESGRIRRNNLIQAYKERGMDAKQAVAAARATITEATRQFAQQQAAELGAAVNTEDATLLNNSLQSQYDAQVSALDASGESRSQTTVTKSRPAVEKGADGGEAIKKALELDVLLEKQGYTPEQRKAALGAVGLAPPGGESARQESSRVEGGKRTEDQAKASSAKAGIDAYGLSVPGVSRDPKTGEWRGDNSIVDYVAPPANREDVKSFYTLGRADTPIGDHRSAAMEGLGRLQSGGVISPDEGKRFEKMLKAAGTPSQIASALNAIETIVTPRLAAADKTSSAAPAEWR